MKIRKTMGRARRHRGRGRGLKLGARAIRALPQDEFEDVVRQSAQAARSSPKQAQDIVRRLRLLRRPPGDVQRPLIIRQGRRDSEVLDALYPERATAWLPSWERADVDNIDLTRFSFLDEPQHTIEVLWRIAEAEARCRAFSINFEDQHCLDVSPYMILGLIRQKMLPVCNGGHVKSRVGKVIHAVHLDEFLNMNIRGESYSPNVFPFPLRQRRGVGNSREDNTASKVTSEERVDTKVVDTISGWLGELERPLELSETGRSNILELFGETLDNAKRHSDPSEDGTWAVAGFMEARSRGGENGTAFVCNFGIISEGNSIYDSLQRAEPNLKDKIARFASEHTPRWPRTAEYDEEALWTLCCLQDGISRVPPKVDGPPNGFGMMTLVEMMNALGKSSRAEEQPRMTIVSGTSCLMVRAPYNVPGRTEAGHRVLALNASNDLRYPPDGDYVFTLPHRFPGTIVSVRFCLDSSELSAAIER